MRGDCLGHLPTTEGDIRGWRIGGRCLYKLPHKKPVEVNGFRDRLLFLDCLNNRNEMSMEGLPIYKVLPDSALFDLGKCCRAIPLHFPYMSCDNTYGRYAGYRL